MVSDKLVRFVMATTVTVINKYIVLNALNEHKLIKWYQKHGFNLTGNVKLNFNNEIKEREMILQYDASQKVPDFIRIQDLRA